MVMFTIELLFSPCSLQLITMCTKSRGPSSTPRRGCQWTQASSSKGLANALVIEAAELARQHYGSINVALPFGGIDFGKLAWLLNLCRSSKASNLRPRSPWLKPSGRPWF